MFAKSRCYFRNTTMTLFNVNIFKNIDLKTHIILAICIRIALIQYANFHDERSLVKYTDVDYSVFTDASRFVLNNSSPYSRHTYRYSPLIAIILTPNIFLHINFGKYLFSLVDVIVGLLIRSIVKHYLKNCRNLKQKKEISENLPELDGKRGKNDNSIEYMSNVCMALWLHNPMSIAIATRGNSDSIAVLLVLVTLYLLQCKRNAFLAGVVHGSAIHLRLYPITYSLTYFMYLSTYSYNLLVKATKPKANGNSIFQLRYLLYLIPNVEQLKLIIGCLLSLIATTGVFYYLYGYEFLYESTIYHLIRKDPRHNFSLFFYLQYLSTEVEYVGLWQKILLILPQFILLLTFSIRYGLNKIALNFAILLETIVIVAYNSVITSQYFVWILGILPLCWWQIRISKSTGAFLGIIWIAAQAAWLLPAYLLEFHGYNTFFFIWVQSVSFFCANMAILGHLIKSFTPSSVHVD